MKRSLSLASSLLVACCALTGAAMAETWTLEPLGSPGNLQVSRRLPVKPALLDAPPVRREALVLVGGAVVCAVVSDFKAPKSTGSHERKVLAEEVRWHLSEMCGRDIPLLPEPPADGVPYVEIALLDVPSQTAVVRVEGRRVLVGGDGPGISHAATYFLECLGCRYLWPGPSGKVIPKKKRIVMPDVRLEKPPEFDLIRRIWQPNCRDETATKTVFPYLKIDQDGYLSSRAKALADRPGNRSFWFWHGLSDVRICRTGSKPTAQEAYSAGGHYFGHYWKKYSAEHPDWFALQPDGTRMNKSSRARLCLSNEGLVREVVRDRVAYFAAHPKETYATLCLSDGSYDVACMCEGCRRLDPVNAPRISFRCYRPTAFTTNYVSLTDRVMTFYNKVAEGVLRECPGKKFKVCAYSKYELAPVKVKPHPSLVFFNCMGSVTVPGALGRERESVAAFLGFGNTVVWRPNILGGVKAQVPMNYARTIYDDLTLFRANGVRGASMDCCREEWALKGFVYYAAARAMFNFDNLSYEGQLADYCAAFGRAAPKVRAYLEALERVHLAALGAGGGVPLLLEMYPIGGLRKLLGEAAALAANSPADSARVAFLMKGLDVGEEQLKMYRAWNTGKWKPTLKAREKYLAFLRDFIPANPVALCPHHLGYAGAYLRGAPRRGAPPPPKDMSKVRGFADEHGNFVEIEDDKKGKKE